MSLSMIQMGAVVVHGAEGSVAQYIEEAPNGILFPSAQRSAT